MLGISFSPGPINLVSVMKLKSLPSCRDFSQRRSTIHTSLPGSMRAIPGLPFNFALNFTSRSPALFTLFVIGVVFFLLFLFFLWSRVSQVLLSSSIILSPSRPSVTVTIIFIVVDCNNSAIFSRNISVRTFGLNFFLNPEVAPSIGIVILLSPSLVASFIISSYIHLMSSLLSKVGVCPMNITLFTGSRNALQVRYLG